MGDNARIEGFKLHSTSRDFGLVVRVSRTCSHPLVTSDRPIPVVYTNHVSNQSSTGRSFELEYRTQREVARCEVVFIQEPINILDKVDNFHNNIKTTGQICVQYFDS